MTGAPPTPDAGYFNAMYEVSADPWGFASRWYEARKYAISVAMLPRRHYRVRRSNRAAPSAC